MVTTRDSSHNIHLEIASSLQFTMGQVEDLKGSELLKNKEYL